jgi:type I restriction enzyme, R subunit
MHKFARNNFLNRFGEHYAKLVVLTDRNDLDDQLFNTFSNCADLLRQTPVQADNRQHLKELLQVASGGIVFTTIQKFSAEPGEEYPQLSDRRNIVFIADEAHRSQYGLNARVVVKSAPEPKTDNVYPIGKRRKSSLVAAEAPGNPYQAGEAEEKEAYISYGFAKYLRDALPNASFIGFTGTPIETTDKNTPAVFGDYDAGEPPNGGASLTPVSIACSRTNQVG